MFSLFSTRLKTGNQQNFADLLGSDSTKKRKRRTSFTPQALEILNEAFEKNTHPSGTDSSKNPLFTFSSCGQTVNMRTVLKKHPFWLPSCQLNIYIKIFKITSTHLYIYMK